MSDHFSEFSLPDTDLTRKTHDLVFSTGPAALANHCVRTYLFGRAVGEAQDVSAGADYDDEVLFLAALLHDMGLTEHGDGSQRFEVDGADLAARFLAENGLDDERVRVVWESIALHTSLGIAHRMRPEIALVHAGSGTDVVGLAAAALPDGLAARVHAAFPRLENGSGLTEAIVEQIVRNPAKAPMGTFPAEIARQYGAGVRAPDWTALVAGAWSGTR